MAAAPAILLFLSWQELTRRSGSPENLHLWPSFLTMLVLAVLVGERLATRRRLGASGELPDFRIHRWMIPAVAVLTLLLIPMFRMVWFTSQNPGSADMLPLIQSVLRDFWRDGNYPYHIHEVSHWTLPLTFPPGLWVPYSLPYWFGLDLRAWNVAAALAMTFVWAGFLWWRAKSIHHLADCIPLLPLLLFPFALLHFGYWRTFQEQSHLTGYWFILFAASVAWLRRSNAAVGVLFAWAIVSRPHLVFLLPLFAVWAWREWRLDRVGVLRFGSAMAITGCGLALPFLLADPGAFFAGMFGGYEEQLSHHVVHNPSLIHGFGLSGMLLEFGLFSFRGPLSLLGVVGIFLLAVPRMRCREDVLAWGALMILWFLCLAIVPWFYVFASPVIMLCVAYAAPFRITRHGTGAWPWASPERWRCPSP